MKTRLPTALSVTALVVALMGTTGIADAVVVGFAANAGKLSGFKASKTAKKNTVVVRGKNGKIDARSIPVQARGPKGVPGPTGPQGPQGPKGDPGAVGGPAGGSLAGTYPNPSLAPNSVGTGQIAAAAVNSAKVLDESLAGDDLANDSLTGAEIDESTLGEVPSAMLGGLGRFASALVGCNPDSLTLITCISVDLNLPKPARVIVIGHIASYAVDAPSEVAGSCELGSSVLDLPETYTPIRFNSPNIPNDTLVGITPPLGPGSVQFRINCNESDANIAYFTPRIAAVALSAS